MSDTGPETVDVTQHDLHDVVAGDVEGPQRTDDGWVSGNAEYRGLHIVPQSGGGDTFIVQPDGHAGRVMSFESGEYDDVLDLVDDLNSIASEWNHLQRQGNKAELVEWAGKMMTSDAERAAENPDIYLEVPEPA